ncbi:SusC/RagA family TonB-linked outer membrane protein [Pseudoflavitalea sp. G-6-1-2]|uniref:SusC/RagA family TonB-linked outer membrane protein n=1 Tax=Pseudoflavitalea sp. G-6-1-2 TaxID=2728841 RepID=UPI00146E3F5A|nr:SusC/RagA family TonB-linked outer membrane protein [Pseudoflavitalea sp. G-6-1-2]NML23280.1 SusC/RagA family TonB-linked outer membrane protein [Pseudoflavitalea sp. G-6-1-2]
MRLVMAHVHMLLMNCFARKYPMPVPVRQPGLKLPGIFMLLLICSMQSLRANQGEPVTLNEKNASLETVMKKIEQQTEYRFWFEKKVLETASKVDIKVSGVSLKTALDICFEKQPLTYQVVEKTIVVKKKTATQTLATEANELIVTTAAFREEVKGVVRNKDGEPLVGASVRVRGTSHGASTNEKGEFTLANVQPGNVLEISMTGYKTSTVKYTGNNSNLIVALEQETRVMTDVVVTGYQNKNRSEYAGAATTVKTKDIKVASLGTLDKMLQGQVAGVAVQNTSSTFGTAPKIRIRGSASLSGINEPLWVLDGVPLEAPLNIVPSELYGGNARNLLASGLSNVNPDDIEDLTILKDATATAMYGTRAVNGVIVVNTKRPKFNTPLRISYGLNTTLSIKPSIKDFDVLNSKDQIDLNAELFEVYQATMMNFSAATSGPYAKAVDLYNRRAITEQQFREMVRDLKTTNTDWFDELYRNSIQQQHSIALAYGSDKSATRISFSYLTDPGKTIGEKTNRFTANFVNVMQLTNNFSGEVLLKYAKRDQKNPGTSINPFSYARDASRAMKPYSADGRYEFYKRGFADFNIINEINNNYIDLSNNDFTAQLGLNLKVNRKLKLTGLFNARFSNSAIDEIQTENSNYANQFRADDFRIRDANERLYKSPGAPSYDLPKTVLPEGGILDRETNTARFYTIRGQAEWNVLDKGDHKLELMGGMEVTQNRQTGNFGRNYGYRSGSKTFAPADLAYERLMLSTNLPEDERRMYNGRNLLQGTSTYVSEFTRNAVSYYGSASYSYLGKYILDASLRNDATNVSGRASRNRFLPTWAVGFAWNLYKENFMEGFSNVISDARVRASYGLRGNAGYRGAELVAYYENILRLYPGYNVTGVNIVESENSALEFEKEYTLSTGFDISFINKIDFSVNYYTRKNFDLVGFKPVQSSSGYQTKLFNWADMKNEGVEVSLNFRPIPIAGEFKWSGNFNLGYNKNTVVSDYQGNMPSVYDAATADGYPLRGRPVTGMYSFQFAGLNDRGLATYNSGKGNRVMGFSETDRDLSNLVYQGSRDPLVSGGFASNFIYKNFTLGVSLVFNTGHVVRKADFYKGGSLNALYRDDRNANADFANRWRAKGNETFTNIPRLILQEDINDYNQAGFFDKSIFNTYNMADIRTINASFMRLRNVTLQYNFERFAKRMKMQNLTVGLEASNLAVFASKRLNGMDPETLLTGLNMPPVKSFTFNLAATF